jgi:hypothetical protein
MVRLKMTNFSLRLPDLPVDRMVRNESELVIGNLMRNLIKVRRIRFNRKIVHSILKYSKGEVWKIDPV